MYWTNYTKVFLTVNTVSPADGFSFRRKHKTHLLFAEGIWLKRQKKEKKESLNEASNPNGNEPATMRVMCAAVESEEITRGCLPYHPVFTRRGRLISYAID